MIDISHENVSSVSDGHKHDQNEYFHYDEKKTKMLLNKTHLQLILQTIHLKNNIIVLKTIHLRKIT